MGATVMSCVFTEAILVHSLALMAVFSAGIDIKDKGPSVT